MKKLPILVLMTIGFPLLAQNSIQLELKNDYLNLPVSYDEEDRVSLELVIGKEVVRYIDIYLPDADHDFWVLLDGSVRFHRQQTMESAPHAVDILLNSKVRFLTLVTTAPQAITSAWSFFVNPVLELAPLDHL